MDAKRIPLFGAVVQPVQEFLRLEAASGVVLLLCAIAALAWANLHSESYNHLFDAPLYLGVGQRVAEFSLREFVNDGLMAIFFFLVGMEIKRELVVGELNTLSKASLPAIAALGGMVLPAAVFLAFNWGKPGQIGWGIPMATDIAFSIGVLTLLKDRVPRALTVFLIALAIFDDIGGILVIVLFYGHGLVLTWLLVALVLLVVLILLNRSYVTSALAYSVVGGALWYALHRGGIHATIAGVMLSFTIPARSRRKADEVLRELSTHVQDALHSANNEELCGAEILMIEEKLEDLEAPLDRFVHLLHGFVAFWVMPVFALANSGVELRGLGLSALLEPVALGTGLGLFWGKQLGVLGATLLAVRLGFAPIPGQASVTKLYGVSLIAGIGFTVALFIATLAFPAAELLDQAKIGILLGSLLAGIAGYLILRFTAAVRGAA